MRVIRPCVRSGESGFSLFEIAVAMAILSLIAGSVLSLLWQAGDTAAEIRTLDQRDEELNRFVFLLRETIEGLPPEATMVMTPASESESGYDELKLENASTAFVFGETVGSSEEVFIALRPSRGVFGDEPSFDLAISRDDFAPDDADGSGMVFNAGADDFLEEDDEGRFWLPLLTGISGAAWRFWEEEQQEWIMEWTDEEKLPPLMEFSVLDNGVSIPSTVVFEVPDRLVDPEAAEQAQAAAQEQQSVTTSAARADSNRGGGGDRRGGDGRGDRGGDGRGDRGGDGRGDRGGDGRGDRSNRGGDGRPGGNSGDGRGSGGGSGGGGSRGGGSGGGGQSGGNSGGGGR